MYVSFCMGEFLGICVSAYVYGLVSRYMGNVYVYGWVSMCMGECLCVGVSVYVYG